MRGEMSTPTPRARLERRQQIAGAAADLEHARALGHDEAHQPLDGAIVGGVLRAPAVALLGEAIVLGRRAR